MLIPRSLSPLWHFAFAPLAVRLALAAPAAIEERGVIDDVSNDISSIYDNLKAGVSKDNITNGVLPSFFAAIPGVEEIKKQLGLNDSDIDDLPLEVLDIPGYANYTSDGWNLRIHGQAYKEPLTNQSVVSNKTLDDAANVFLPDLDISQLSSHEQDNARNLTSAILSIPQEGVLLNFNLQVADNQTFSSNWNATLIWDKPTDSRGELDGFVQLPTTAAGQLPDGNNTGQIVRLDVHTNGSSTGNATAYLVPKDGVTIVSDIDDILRVTKIYEPKEGLLNSFARDFTPWLNMPEIYANWSTHHTDNPIHFHYLTTTPEPATKAYMDFIYKNYPLGSFDTRPYNFTTVDQTFSIRKVLLEKIIQTFPSRKFVLVGDTTNPDVMRDYPLMATTYPNIQCIWLRNTSATDSGDDFPYDTSGFKSLKPEQYMFFYTPDDLTGLDPINGDCRNTSVTEDATFGWQNLPLGIKDQHGTADGGFSALKTQAWLAAIATILTVVLTTGGL